MTNPLVLKSAPPRADARGPRSGMLIAVCAAVLALAVLLWPLAWNNEFALTLGILIAINLIGAVSLHLIVRTGHVSLAHAGFMGLGGYATALSLTRFHLVFPFDLLAGAVVPALVALVIGPLLLRLSGKYFVLVTFMVGEVIRLTFTQWSSLTGGANGLFGIPVPFKWLDSLLHIYYFTLLVSALCVGLVVRIMTSELGRAIDSIREAQRVSECSGVPAIRMKVTMFAIGSALVGIAGSMQVYFLHYIDPSAFTIVQSLNFLIMNVIGGMEHLAGAVIGTVFMVVLPQALQEYVNVQQIIFGLILVGVMIGMPGGLMDVVKRLRPARASRHARSAAHPHSASASGERR
jgi:branched-chain amino acid transport system permease protein